MTITISNKHVQIDEQFYLSSVFNDYYWSINQDGYVRGDHKRNGARVRMHRLVLGLTDPKTYTDHINGDRADNRKCNLRPATKAENNAHKTVTAGGKYRNVYTAGKGRGWKIIVEFKGKRHFGGRFLDRDEAAKRAPDFRNKIQGIWA